MSLVHFLFFVAALTTSFGSEIDTSGISATNNFAAATVTVPTPVMFEEPLQALPGMLYPRESESREVTIN